MKINEKIGAEAHLIFLLPLKSGYLEPLPRHSLAPGERAKGTKMFRGGKIRDTQPHIWASVTPRLRLKYCWEQRPADRSQWLTQLASFICLWCLLTCNWQELLIQSSVSFKEFFFSSSPFEVWYFYNGSDFWFFLRFFVNCISNWHWLDWYVIFNRRIE